MKAWQSWLGLAAWLGFVALAASLGGQFTDPDWYLELRRPAWAPPAWVFGPVWTLLYAGMAVAAWLVWRPGGFSAAPKALNLFGVQLVGNAAWPWIFFELRLPGWAFVQIILLWALILATLLAFWRHSRAAALLLLPYLGWVTFAAALNYAVWRLNIG